MPGSGTRTTVTAYTTPGAATASVRNISAFQQAGHVLATGKVSVPHRGQRVARSSARPSGSGRQESGSSRRAGPAEAGPDKAGPADGPDEGAPAGGRPDAGRADAPEDGSGIGAEDVEGVPAQGQMLVLGFQRAQRAAAHQVQVVVVAGGCEDVLLQVGVQAAAVAA